MRKVLALAVAIAALAIVATTVSAADVTVKMAAVAGSGVTCDATIVTADGPPFVGSSVKCTGTLPTIDAAAKTGATIVMYYKGADCKYADRIAILYNGQRPATQAAVVLPGEGLVGAIITAADIPPGSPPPGAAFSQPVDAVKSIGAITMTKPYDQVKGVLEDGHKVLACGNAGGGGVSPTAKPATTATVTGVGKPGTGYSDGSVWTWFVVAGFLAVTGGALVTVGAKARR